MTNNFKYWWLVLLKGVILIVLSFFVFFNPIETLIGLALYIGISLLFTGVFIIYSAIKLKEIDDTWRWRLAEGIIDLFFAFILLTNPGITAAIFPFIVGFWIIVYGIMMFVDSFKAKKESVPYWWSGLFGGLVSVLIGYCIISNILIGAITITFWIGLGFLIFGLVNIAISLRMKGVNKTLQTGDS